MGLVLAWMLSQSRGDSVTGISTNLTHRKGQPARRCARVGKEWIAPHCGQERGWYLAGDAGLFLYGLDKWSCLLSLCPGHVEAWLPVLSCAPTR